MLKTRIGKYKIFEKDKSLKIKYVYTFSDLFGLLINLIGFSLGLFLIYVFYYNLNKFKIDYILILACGLWFSIWFGKILFILISTFKQSCIEIDRKTREISIFDYKKTEKINFDKISSIYCKIESEYKPKDKYGILIFQTFDKEKIEGFIIRSSIPFDIGKGVDKDIYKVSSKLKEKIFEFITKE
jgi:hypothetical protein